MERGFWDCVSRVLLSLVVLIACTAVLRAEFVSEDVKLVPLTDDGRSKAVSWAYHGDWISFIRDIPGSGQNQLFVIKADASSEQAVTPIGDTFFAQWSWKGDKLSYLFANASDDESQGGAYIYDLNTQHASQISAPYPRSALDEDEGPLWSSDDRYLVYKTLPGASGLREIWVHDSQVNKTWRLLADRGEVQEASWRGTLPNRLCLRVQAAGGWDIVAVNPDGKDIVQLTDIGAESLDVDKPRWSPAEDLIAFAYNKNMTQTERESDRLDCWVIRPDGSDARNLTNATSPATEKQLELDEFYWSWDGRWILASGERFDIQGNDIDTLYLIDPHNGGYRILLTSYPRENSEIEECLAYVWSYDSTKIALLCERRVVRNWGPDPIYEQYRTVLSLYDIKTDTRTDLLLFDHEQDRKKLLGETDRDPIESLSWSPDNRSLLVTIAEIVSESDNIFQPDVYRVDLPEHLISSQAANHNGPHMGRPQEIAENTIDAEQTLSERASATISVTNESTVLPKDNGIVIEKIVPQHISVEQILAALPGRYSQYLTVSTTQNLFVYEGPTDALKRLQCYLRILDKKSPQILVDLLAVELTDEANRELGLDWTYAQGHFGLFQPVGNAIRDLTPDTRLDGLTTFPGAGQLFYQGVGSLPHEFFVRLNALVADGRGTILANPRIVATSSQEAMIQIRKTLNYFFNEGYDTAGRPIVKKSDISADTQGRITPTLLADGSIHMVVDVKVGSFTFSPDAGLPEQTNRESTTVVTVKDGQTLVIGGLRQQEMGESVAKVPLLGDLPLIGYAFKKTKKETKNSVLTLFVTPHVLQDDGNVPEWPQLDAEEHTIQPIMPQPSEPEKSSSEK